MLTFRRHPGGHARCVWGASALERVRGRLTGGARGGSQDGFLLIEVLVSALLLGLIAAATVTGLQAVDDNTSNQRFHNEAVLLAAQSQEELRSSPVSSLEKLLNNPRTYTDTVDNTGYTIKQEAHELNGKEEATGCTVVEHGAYTAPNFRVTSTVSWHSLKGGHPVSESSIITPPTSSSLEVDVDNAPSPTAGVPEVPVVVTYDAYETGTPLKLEGTTDNQGCVFFTGIRATSAIVEVPEKSKFVTPSGALKVPSQELSIAPNVTTRDAVTYDAGGAIAATFTYKAQTEYEGKKVTGDTFVAANTEMGLSPELEVGTAGAFSYESGGEERYTAHTGTTNYNISGVTAKGGRYEHGDLFPFPSAWTVYAGDCAANNPASVTKGAVNPGEGVVTANNTIAVAAPESLVKLEALTGTEKSHESATRITEALRVKITNLSCSAASPAPPTPNNAASVSYVHEQHLASGVLEDPFQPFGKFELCLQVVEKTTEPEKDKLDKFIYENVNSEGAKPTLYPQELSPTEAKAKREATETSKLASEESAGHITHAERLAIEKAAAEAEKTENEQKAAKAAKSEAQTVESGSTAKC